MNGCIWKQFLASNSPQVPLNLICLTIVVSLMPLTQFNLELEQLICKNLIKFVLLDTYFSELLTDVQIWY